MVANMVETSLSRIFFQEDGANPDSAPSYQGLWRAGGISWDQGDNNIIYIPDPNQYRKFIRAGSFQGAPGNPGLTITARYTFSRSELLRLARKGCTGDLHIHFGECGNPQDFNGGFQKSLILEDMRVTSYGTGDLGALGPDEQAQINEEVPVEGADLIEIVPLTFARVATGTVNREVIDIAVCDSPNCGFCGTPSDGCQVIFAATAYSVGSPGLMSEVVYSRDGGSTWGDVDTSGLSASESPSGIACVGANLIVISNASQSLFYAAIAEVVYEEHTWSEVTSGFVGAGAPNAIHSASPTSSWIVGDGGYIYFTEDPTSSVTVQSAGAATTQDLLAVHAADEENVAAVGANNAFVYSNDAGATWGARTGPAVGVQLNAVWMKDENTILVGTDGGELYYTRDGGRTWEEKGFPGSGAGSVKDIRFVGRNVGYMAHNTAGGLGRVLRTLNGGFSWYVLPEGTATMPTNTGFNALATCVDHNIVFAGGSFDATTGMIVKGAG